MKSPFLKGDTGGFNEAKYKALLERLEIKEVKISRTQQNKDFRTDSNFWTKEPKKNNALKYDRIGNLLKRSQYGISIEMNEEGDGYPIYRMNEIHNMMCDLDVNKYAEISQIDLEKFKLIDRDVVFNRTNSYEWVGRTGIYRKKDEKDFVFASYLVRFIPNEEIIIPEYLTTYLNTKYGIWDVKRRSRHSINQTNVNPEEVKEIEIPIIGKEFQSKIKENFDKAHSNRLKSNELYYQAEKFLLEAIGLKDFIPQNSPFVKSLSHDSPFVKGDKGGLTKEHLQQLGINTDNLIFGPNFIPYNPNLKTNSRELRNDSTLSEVLLWNQIKGDSFGYRFNRQKPLLHYIVDFYCPTLNLVIEVDGSSHDDEKAVKYDFKRHKELESIGIEFLRFTDLEVKKDMSNVLRSIEVKIEEIEKRIPLTPFKKGGIRAMNKEGVNIKSYKESFLSTGRLDAEYYQPKYEQIVSHIIEQKHDILKNLVSIKKSIEPGSDYYSNEGIPFLRVSDFNKFGLTEPEKKLSSDFYNEYANQIVELKPKRETILFSKDGTVGIAYMLKEDMEIITSGAILHLTVKNKKDILPEYLTLVLNSKLIQMQAERDSGGSIILHWRLGEIENIVVPIIEIEKQQQISDLVEESFMLKKESENLLEVAKRAVEIAIEQDEESGIRLIEKIIRKNK